MIEKFEDIISWQKSQELAINTYSTFRDLKDYWFKDQIQRACVSISNNIAEWFERKTNNELIYFLYVSKGSCWEYRSMLYLALKLNYINKDNFDLLLKNSLEISKLISWLIKSIK